MSTPRSLPLSSLKTLKTTLPATWYTNKPLHDLERRALFSKHWLLTTHTSQLPKPGDFVRYTSAGIPFFIVRDREPHRDGEGGGINVFLNVCRHRAFPVVQRDHGRANRFICKFHGWTYDLQGRLSKAPEFDAVQDFNRSDFPLYKVHSKVDKRGFVYVNFDAAETPAVKWEEQFAEVDEIGSGAGQHPIDPEKYKHAGSTSVPCNFNCKTLADSFNECYHCKVAHPSISEFVDMDKYKVTGQRGVIKHDPNVKGMENPSIVLCFPNAYYNAIDGAFYIGRINPTSPTTVNMEYEFYRHVDSSDADFNEFKDFFDQIEHEDRELCRKTQQNLDSGVFVGGPLHPQHEIGLVHFKQMLSSILTRHRDQEAEAGKLIEPARRLSGAEDSLDEMLFCDGLCEPLAQADTVSSHS